MRGKINHFTIDYQTKKQYLTLELTSDFRPYFDDLKETELDIDLKKHREKRSLNANALCWKLCTEIANVLRASKEEVYLKMLKEYGQSTLISVLADINVAGYLKYYEVAGRASIKGKEFIHYKVYKGSSEYDTQEMSILLDGIVSEAKELGIQVLSASELDLIKNEWKKGE